MSKCKHGYLIHEKTSCVFCRIDNIEAALREVRKLVDTRPEPNQAIRAVIDGAISAADSASEPSRRSPEALAGSFLRGDPPFAACTAEEQEAAEIVAKCEVTLEPLREAIDKARTAARTLLGQRTSEASPELIEEWERQYIWAVDKLRWALGVIRSWDMLNPTPGAAEPLADGPFFRAMIDEVLSKTIPKHEQRTNEASAQVKDEARNYNSEPRYERQGTDEPSICQHAPCSQCGRLLTVPVEDRPFTCGFCLRGEPRSETARLAVADPPVHAYCTYRRAMHAAFPDEYPYDFEPWSALAQAERDAWVAVATALTGSTERG